MHGLGYSQPDYYPPVAFAAYGYIPQNGRPPFPPTNSVSQPGPLQGPLPRGCPFFSRPPMSRLPPPQMSVYHRHPPPQHQQPPPSIPSSMFGSVQPVILDNLNGNSSVKEPQLVQMSLVQPGTVMPGGYQFRPVNVGQQFGPIKCSQLTIACDNSNTDKVKETGKQPTPPSGSMKSVTKEKTSISVGKSDDITKKSINTTSGSLKSKNSARGVKSLDQIKEKSTPIPSAGKDIVGSKKISPPAKNKKNIKGSSETSVLSSAASPQSARANSSGIVSKQTQLKNQAPKQESASHPDQPSTCTTQYRLNPDCPEFKPSGIVGSVWNQEDGDMDSTLQQSGHAAKEILLEEGDCLFVPNYILEEEMMPVELQDAEMQTMLLGSHFDSLCHMCQRKLHRLMEVQSTTPGMSPQIMESPEFNEVASTAVSTLNNDAVTQGVTSLEMVNYPTQQLGSQGSNTSSRIVEYNSNTKTASSAIYEMPADPSPGSGFTAVSTPSQPLIVRLLRVSEVTERTKKCLSDGHLSHLDNHTIQSAESAKVSLNPNLYRPLTNMITGDSLEHCEHQNQDNKHSFAEEFLQLQQLYIKSLNKCEKMDTSQLAARVKTNALPDTSTSTSFGQLRPEYRGMSGTEPVPSAGCSSVITVPGMVPQLQAAHRSPGQSIPALLSLNTASPLPKHPLQNFLPLQTGSVLNSNLGYISHSLLQDAGSMLRNVQMGNSGNVTLSNTTNTDSNVASYAPSTLNQVSKGSPGQSAAPAAKKIPPPLDLRPCKKVSQKQQVPLKSLASSLPQERNLEPGNLLAPDNLTRASAYPKIPQEHRQAEMSYEDARCQTSPLQTSNNSISSLKQSYSSCVQPSDSVRAYKCSSSDCSMTSTRKVMTPLQRKLHKVNAADPSPPVEFQNQLTPFQKTNLTTSAMDDIDDIDFEAKETQPVAEATSRQHSHLEDLPAQKNHPSPVQKLNKVENPFGSNLPARSSVLTTEHFPSAYVTMNTANIRSLEQSCDLELNKKPVFVRSTFSGSTQQTHQPVQMQSSVCQQSSQVPPIISSYQRSISGLDEDYLDTKPVKTVSSGGMSPQVHYGDPSSRRHSESSYMSLDSFEMDMREEAGSKSSYDNTKGKLSRYMKDFNREESKSSSNQSKKQDESSDEWKTVGRQKNYSKQMNMLLAAFRAQEKYSNLTGLIMKNYPRLTRLQSQIILEEVFTVNKGMIGMRQPQILEEIKKAVQELYPHWRSEYTGANEGTSLQANITSGCTDQDEQSSIYNSCQDVTEDKHILEQEDGHVVNSETITSSLGGAIISSLGTEPAGLSAAAASEDRQLDEKSIDANCVIQ